MVQYQDFLLSKVARAERSGVEIDASEIHPSLFPHQRDTAVWSLQGGRRGEFLSFGLGKTRIQAEIMRQLHLRHAGRCGIVCPLGVKHEFVREGRALGIEFQYVRNNDEVRRASSPFLLTNYERVRDGQVSPDLFTAVSLDEASVLRSYGSKTYQEFLSRFGNVPHRYVATATPSPNRFKELIHYGAFLGIMDSGQALTRFFQRDSSKANNLTLYPHKEAEFWHWLSTWGLFVTKPSDLGYSDAGYDLPPLNVVYHEIKVSHVAYDVETDGQLQAFRVSAKDLKAAASIKRDTITQRLDKALSIIDAGGPDRHWLLWHHLEDERRAIQKALPEAVTVYGSQDLEEREEKIVGFSEGQYRILATKPEIAGSGCNFQRHCSDAIFMGVDYKFNDFIQAIHRLHRFQQPHPVNIHIIYSDLEYPVVKAFNAKWQQHDRLVEEMTSIIRRRGLSHAA